MARGLSRRLGAALLALSGLALTTLGACDDPKQDVFKSVGGISPDPTGVISGSILYAGPRPSCEYEAGAPTRVKGRVILFLFAYDNPPPPEGHATTALNLYVVNGSKLFTTDDCLPEGAAVDPSEVVTRIVSYYWPQITLGEEAAVAYQVRGFYDSDEDMNPFFSVKNLPTAGDVVGAALADVQDPSKGFLPIGLPPAGDAPDGYVREGVTVALGNYVWLERPAFEPSAQNRFLASDARIAITPKTDNSGDADPSKTVFNMWESLCEGSADNCGYTLLQLSESQAGETFRAADVELNFSPETYAFVSEPVDILTVRPGAQDQAKPDGLPDPHPLLGFNAGVPWFTPIVIMTRTAPTDAQAAVEQLAAIPNVRLIASTLLDDAGTGPSHRVQRGELALAVPPVAVVELDPDDTSCRVPYLAPGNYKQAFESLLTYCHELPTGFYGMSVIQGAAGGTRRAEPDPEISQNGLVVDGATLSGQVWTVPNELASEEQVGAGNTLASQGREQLFVVHDPNPDLTGDCTTALDPLTFQKLPVAYRGICTPADAPFLENPSGVDGPACLPASCCDSIAHLCGVPLCPLCDDDTCPGVDVGGRQIRSGPTKIVSTTENGKRVPDCVPFELPTLCCN